MKLDIQEGDCRERMAEMEPASFDAIVTDPPYGLSFMGNASPLCLVGHSTVIRRSWFPAVARSNQRGP